jgi:hypothetical protein
MNAAEPRAKLAATRPGVKDEEEPGKGKAACVGCGAQFALATLCKYDGKRCSGCFKTTCITCGSRFTSATLKKYDGRRCKGCARQRVNAAEERWTIEPGARLANGDKVHPCNVTFAASFKGDSNERTCTGCNRPGGRRRPGCRQRRATCLESEERER